MNTYANAGTVDISDMPNLAFGKAPGATGGDFGATLRQTELGLEVVGPQLAEAATGGDLQADFFGGFPDVNYGVTSGLFRLRTARGYLDWGTPSVGGCSCSLFLPPFFPNFYPRGGRPPARGGRNSGGGPPKIW